MSKLLLAPVLLVLLAGCTAQRRGKDPVGVTSEVEHIEEEAAPDAAPARPAANVVEQRRRGFSGVFAASGEKLDADTLLTHLAAADAVCIGEEHDSLDDHFAQLAVVEGLLERRPMRGFSLGLGFEMVRIQFQRPLSAYARGSGTLLDLEQGIAFSTEWGFPIEYYAPLFDEARATESDLIPLGVDRELTHEVAKNGLAGLAPQYARQLPEIEPSSARHRQIFDELMKGHPGPTGEGTTGESDTSDLHERLYQAQLVWDESMADRAAAYLRDRAPNGKLVIIAGAAHCHYTAIPERLERRGFETIGVLPVHDAEPGAEQSKAASEAHAQLRDLLANDYDYHLVLDAR